LIAHSVIPPSTGNTAPVTYDAAADALAGAGHDDDTTGELLTDGVTLAPKKSLVL
jgi:hypothetical protein